MSAYGSIPSLTSTITQQTTVWSHSRPSPTLISIHHVRFASLTDSLGIEETDRLIAYLHTEFSDIVERGRTYPQLATPSTPYTRQHFLDYFFAGDVFIALIHPHDSQSSDLETKRNTKLLAGTEFWEADLALSIARASRPWEECLAGFYYTKVKPNYPGRSSHICNAGFVTPTVKRGHGFGTLIAKSYLHYAPRLGYKASVFNLVYVTNTPSIRIWESLNFIKVGRIPKAGLLKGDDAPLTTGKTIEEILNVQNFTLSAFINLGPDCKAARAARAAKEEYVDAWVFYRDFDLNEAVATVVSQ